VKKSYATPGAMEKAIRSKAQQVSLKTGVSTGDLVMRFHYQRLLARVFQEEGWMLKGGQALLVRFPEQARAAGTPICSGRESRASMRPWPRSRAQPSGTSGTTSGSPSSPASNPRPGPGTGRRYRSRY